MADKDMQAAHRAFREGVSAVEGCTVDQAGKHDHDYNRGLLSDDIQYNPAKSGAQRRYMGAALGRKRAGKSRGGDPKMTESQMADYARKGR